MSFKKPFRAVPLKAISPYHRSRQPSRDWAFMRLVGGLSAGLFATILFLPAKQAQAVHESNSFQAVYYAGCNEARAAGAAPIHRGEPGYRPEMDGDNDGIACEPYRGR